ncbi:MAG: SDR family oxidoreductase [Spirochaetaceae bacterium]|nr:SDR family oxidoreductase [Myxococcales bacterium]MCB9726648.1 SDR family oxidoreductase [Spirochaetaceae bacterium]HPG24879.1 SDR family NAD(P)-dependent oxidoreductase [Myxococcota bacterium]
MSISRRLEGRSALVTGGASGIGRASARRLAAEGARVAIGDLDEAGAAAVVQEIEAEGGHAIARRVDVSDEAAFRALIDETVEAFGRLDVLHNNAAALGRVAIGGDDEVEHLAVDVWDRTFAINARSVLIGCKHAIPRMLEQGGGSIVNTSSGAAILGGLSGTAYASSKAAVNCLTQYVAAQYGKRGIRCNAILPGLIMTPAVAVGMTSESVEMILDHHMTPEAGRPEDIAAMVAFLASDEARYVTGQLIRVDGGITSHAPTYADIRRAVAAGR